MAGVDEGLIKTCIHCGFCLPTCPTYVVWGEEMDSPRGRIVLMREAAETGGEVGSIATHIDRCLGCMACVTACPSGVRYDVLIEQMRPEVERRHRRSLADRAFRRFCFEVFTHPGRLRAAVPLLVAGRRLGLDRRLHAWLERRASGAHPPGLPPSAGSPGAAPDPAAGAAARGDVRHLATTYVANRQTSPGASAPGPAPAPGPAGTAPAADPAGTAADPAGTAAAGPADATLAPGPAGATLAPGPAGATPAPDPAGATPAAGPARAASGPGGAAISMAGSSPAGATESPGLEEPAPSGRVRGRLTGFSRRVRRSASAYDGGVFRRVAAMAWLTPEVRLSAAWRRLPERTAASTSGGPGRGTVGLLQGCVARVFFSRTNEATVRVLAAEGFDVVAPKDAGCCGALLMHSGAEDEARERARATIEAFAGCETVAVNAAGCGSAMKEYGRLLAGDAEWAERAEAFVARVADVTEVLAGVEPRARRHPVPMTVAYHDACHLAHAQKIRAEPRSLLAGIPGLTVEQPAEWEICCGSAGLYNMLEPEPAAELGRRKVANLRATGAEAVVAGNPGCTLQIIAHSDRQLPVYHPVELLDASISGRSLR